MSTRRGSVLILALWATSTLTMLTVTQTGMLGTAWRLMERQGETITAWQLAYQGFSRALDALQSDEERGWDAPVEDWGAWQEEIQPEGAWRARAEDDGGKICVNTTPRSVLARLPESSPALAEAMTARRAERPFRHLAELAFVPGVSAEQLRLWRSLLTPLGRGPVNVNSASADVLEVLGLTRGAAERFVAWRRGGDGELGTADDHVIRDPGELADAAARVLRPGEAVVLTNLVASGDLGVQSRAFRIVAVSISVGPAKTSRSIVALVERGARHATPVIRGWHED